MENGILFQRIKALVATERRIGVEILECLHQIEVRKAFAELRYDGLYSYCVKELGFTESQAYQRIQAMRALKEMPELASKIESGALSVSSVAKVQRHFREERKRGVRRPKVEKLELFRAVENRTIREVEATLAEIRGETVEEKIVFELDEELAGLWREVRDLAAHRSGGSDRETLRVVVRDWLERNDPKRKARRAKVRGDAPDPSVSRADASGEGERDGVGFELKSRSTPRLKSTAETRSADESVAAHPGLRRSEPWSTWNGTPRANTVSRKSSTSLRCVPASLKREIWLRDGGKCIHCGSQHALEIDHRIAFARGGRTEVGNLRLLCRSCNAYAAVQVFGARKIQAERVRKRESRSD